MNLIRSILYCVLAVTMISCNSKSKQEECRGGSYEFSPVNALDTINRIDCHGWKQGKWVPSKWDKRNPIKDTTYFRNDTIIEKPIK